MPDRADEARPVGPTTEVLDVEVERDAEVRVRFADGTTARFDLVDLRRSCPCAGCRGARDQDRSPYTGDTISVLDAELHGAWGISLHWSDGHRTGIYAWTYLRGLHDGTASLPEWDDHEHSLP